MAADEDLTTKLREINTRPNTYICLVKQCSNQKQATGKLCPFHSQCSRELAFEGVMHFVDQVYTMDDQDHKFHNKENKRVSRRDRLVYCNVEGCQEIHNVMYSGKCTRHHEMFCYMTDSGITETLLEALLRFDANHGSTTCSMPCNSGRVFGMSLCRHHFQRVCLICKEQTVSWPKAKAALKLQIIDRERRKLAAQEAEQAVSVVEQTVHAQLAEVKAEVEMLKEMLAGEDQLDEEAVTSLQARIDRLIAKEHQLQWQADLTTAEAHASIEQDSQELTQTNSAIEREREGGGGYV